MGPAADRRRGHMLAPLGETVRDELRAFSLSSDARRDRPRRRRL